MGGFVQPGPRANRGLLDYSVGVTYADRFQRPLKSLRISVTDRCNFRCTYCMPADRYPADYPFLPRSEVLTFEEVSRLAGLFVAAGVSKIRLTGGEPLLRKGVVDLVAQLKRIDGLRELTLTSNGALLGSLARSLKSAGLDRITVSLDSLDPDRFAAISDTTVPLRQVVEGIEAALQAGLTPLKLNCVLQRGVNEQDALPLAAWARERGFTARFIEFMDVGSADHWRLDQVVPSRDLQAAIHHQWPLERIPDGPGGRVADRFRYLDGRGEVGFISSVTEPFCSGCDRARLSADGHLYTCLFASEGLDLKRLLRGGAGDAEILGVVEARWRLRDDRYSELRTEATAQAPKVAMHRVGG